MNPLAVDTAVAQGTISGRALELLGSGVPQEAVASALGVTAAYVSQLLSDAAFAAEVTRRKYDVLSKHTERDAAYDSLEDSLLEKLGKVMPLMFKPVDIMKALQLVNGAKRRGADSKESIITQQNIVEITIPTQIVQQFTTNIANQVVKTGDTDLITIQSGDLLKNVEGSQETMLPKPDLQSTQETIPEPKILENNTILDSL